jgi:hypothetical protein
VAGVAPATIGAAGVSGPPAPAVAGPAVPLAMTVPGLGTGASIWVARGTACGGGTGTLGCATRAAAPALTRCSSSAARSGARPAHSRSRLSSRAWAKESNDRIAIAASAANAAMAPIWVNVLESDSASSEGIMNLESV